MFISKEKCRTVILFAAMVLAFTFVGLSGTVQTAYAADPTAVCRLTADGYGPTEFNDLQEAFDAAKNCNDPKIELIKDTVYVNKSVINEEGASVTLDLAGKKIVAEQTVSYDGSNVIENKGILTIMDSSQEETGKIEIDEDLDLIDIIYNDNTGTLTISGGTIAGGYNSYHSIESHGTLTINGGTINAVYATEVIRVEESQADRLMVELLVKIHLR